MKLASVLLTALLMPTAASADNSILGKADYVKCMGHIERASQAALFNKPTQAEIAGALACSDDARQNLSLDQIEQLIYIYRIFKVQIETPSATAQSQLVMETMQFLRTLD